MTCIVGIEKEGRVYLGGDHAAVNPWTITDSGVPKVFKKGKIIAGYSGSFRFGQLLQYAFAIPEQKKDQDIMEYLSIDFVNSLRAALKEGGLARVSDNVESIGWSDALIGYRGVLYELDNDFQIRPRKIAAIGSGYIAALGVMNHIMRTSPKMRPEKVLEHALISANAITHTVAGPFDFIKSRKGS